MSNHTMNLEVVGQGATTKIYRDGDKAIKLYEHGPLSVAENEARQQAFAAKAGLPVPAVYGVRQLEGSMVALDMQYIPGSPIMRIEMDRAELQAAIQTLVRLQRMAHGCDAAGLPRLKDRLTQRISRNPYIDSAQKTRLLTLLDRLDTGASQICHGDFHPLNILFDGEKHWIIDWVDVSAGDPLADACRTYLLFRQHISRLAGSYLRAFCKEAGATKEEVLAWLPILAAARMIENQDEKARIFLAEFVNSP